MEWSGRAQPHRRVMLGWASVKGSTAMRNKSIATIATMGMDIGIDMRLDTRPLERGLQ